MKETKEKDLPENIYVDCVLCGHQFVTSKGSEQKLCAPCQYKNPEYGKEPTNDN